MLTSGLSFLFFFSCVACVPNGDGHRQHASPNAGCLSTQPRPTGPSLRSSPTRASTTPSQAVPRRSSCRRRTAVPTVSPPMPKSYTVRVLVVEQTPLPPSVTHPSARPISWLAARVVDPHTIAPAPRTALTVVIFPSTRDASWPPSYDGVPPPTPFTVSTLADEHQNSLAMARVRRFVDECIGVPP